MRVHILSPQRCVNCHYLKLIFLNSNSTQIKHKIWAFKCHISFWNQFTLSYWIFVLLWCQKWTDLCSINLKKVICSTGFYSPAGIKNEGYECIQLSMWRSAAESRRFGRKSKNKAKNSSDFGLILNFSAADAAARDGKTKTIIKE